MLINWFYVKFFVVVVVVVVFDLQSVRYFSIVGWWGSNTYPHLYTIILQIRTYAWSRKISYYHIIFNHTMSIKLTLPRMLSKERFLKRSGSRI